MPTFDAGSSGSSASASSLSTGSFTIASNSNRWLVCFINDIDSVGVTSVKWNTSETFTAVPSGSGTYNGGSSTWHVYYLTAPSAATSTVDVVFSGTGQVAIVAGAFYDVDQTTPFDAIDSATGSSAAPQNTVTSATGDLVVGGNIWAGGATSSNPTDTETEVVSRTRCDLYTLAGAASASMDITLGASREWALPCLNVNAVAGAANTRRYSLPLTGVG